MGDSITFEERVPGKQGLKHNSIFIYNFDRFLSKSEFQENILSASVPIRITTGTVIHDEFRIARQNRVILNDYRNS